MEVWCVYKVYRGCKVLGFGLTTIYNGGLERVQGQLLSSKSGLSSTVIVRSMDRDVAEEVLHNEILDLLNRCIS